MLRLVFCHSLTAPGAPADTSPDQALLSSWPSPALDTQSCRYLGIIMMSQNEGLATIRSLKNLCTLLQCRIGCLSERSGHFFQLFSPRLQFEILDIETPLP